MIWINFGRIPLATALKGYLVGEEQNQGNQLRKGGNNSGELLVSVEVEVGRNVQSLDLF